MNTNTNAPAFDMASLLQGTLDDLADMPEFKNFPAGTHRCRIFISQKEVAGHPSFELLMKHMETLELTDPTQTPPAPSDEASTLYMMDNELGQGSFKKLLKSLVEGGITGANVSELIQNANNSECLVVTGLRKKKGTTKEYMDVVELQVV